MRTFLSHETRFPESFMRLSSLLGGELRTLQGEWQVTGPFMHPSDLAGKFATHKDANRPDGL
jgi:hypothetical protein